MNAIQKKIDAADSYLWWLVVGKGQALGLPAEAVEAIKDARKLLNQAMDLASSEEADADQDD